MRAGTLLIDLRYAWRSLHHSRFFAGIAVLLLAVGIGLSTAVFSLVNGIMLEPLPYPNADRLVRISDERAVFPFSAPGRMSDVSLGGWAHRTGAVSHLAPYGSFEIITGLPDGAASLIVADVGPDFFTVFAMPPASGRVLLRTDADPSVPPAAVISERLAWRAYGGPQAALGKAIGLETLTHVIVGVLPTAFAMPGADVDVWRPGRSYWRLPKPGERRNLGMNTQVAALLRPGATIADAERMGREVADALAFADDAVLDGLAAPPSFKVTRLLDEMVAPVRPALVVLSGGMALVLLAVCVTMANLVLARNASRQREIAVRVALGAGRWRVARPVLFEQLMLTALGAGGGALLAWWLLRTLPAMAPGQVPRIETIHFDVATVTIAIVIALIIAIGLGWLPLVQIGSANVAELTATGARVRIGRMRRSADQLRSVLVVGQVAVAVALLVCALLIGRSFAALLHLDLGYRPEGVITFQAAQTFLASREPGRLRTYYTRLVEELQGHPAVAAAGAVSVLPLTPLRSSGPIQIVGRPLDSTSARANMGVYQAVSPGYLDTIGTRVLQGRGLTPRDDGSAERVALVDDVLASRYFPAGDAIGHQITWARNTYTVVGVVEAIRLVSLGETPRPTVYVPADQAHEFLAYGRAGIAVRARGDARQLESIARDIARRVDARVPIYNVRPLADHINGSVAQPRFFTLVLGVFAALALSTALLGIYGVLAYAVERRRVEFGIRRALGATEGHVIRLVMRHGVVLAVCGLAIGLAAAAAGGRYLRALLFGVTPSDVLSYAGASILVLLVVVAASWAPVRAALRIDPARALRVE